MGDPRAPRGHLGQEGVNCLCLYGSDLGGISLDPLALLANELVGVLCSRNPAKILLLNRQEVLALFTLPVPAFDFFHYRSSCSSDAIMGDISRAGLPSSLSFLWTS